MSAYPTVTETGTVSAVDTRVDIASTASVFLSAAAYFPSSWSRPDMTFAVDWALKTNYLAFRHPGLDLIDAINYKIPMPPSVFVFHVLVRPVCEGKAQSLILMEPAIQS